MPLTRNLGHLERFLADLLQERKGNREIGYYNLEYEIARVFGYSKYVQKSVLEALIKYGLVKVIGANRYKIMYGLSEKDKEREIDEELDKYMKAG